MNAHGGLLGRQVTLTILNDNSSPTQAQTNYQTLFAQDKVDLAFGPFSSLLTTPSASVAARYDYALIEGAGGAPSVFESPANVSAHNVFDVSLPIEDEMIPFVSWVASMPPSERPKTAAYPMADDPFADPPVQLAQQKLQRSGSRRSTRRSSRPRSPPTSRRPTRWPPPARRSWCSDPPTSRPWPRSCRRSSSSTTTPRCSSARRARTRARAFTSAVGKGNATGMMVPNGWYPGYANAASQAMVQEYVAKYGGSPSDVNADVAEGYSVGQVMAQAVTATGGTDNAKIISYLHSGVSAHQRPGAGEIRFAGQEQRRGGVHLPVAESDTTFKQVLPVAAAGSVPIINPKPNWTS